MDNFWGLLLQGITSIINTLVFNNAPPHQSMHLVEQVVGIASTTLGLAFVVIFSNFNMLPAIFVATTIFIMEPIHFVYAAWRWFKKIIIN